MNNPFRALLGKLDQEVTEQIQAKVTVGTDAALAEVPILAQLLKGEEVTLSVKIQLKGQ
jgi:hypothetical protein